MNRIRVRRRTLSLLLAMGLGASFLPMSTASAGEADFTGEPLTILVMGPFSDVGYDDPEWPGAAQARAQFINKKGGLEDASGVTHELKVLVCNQGSSDINKATGCAQEGVDAGVVAAIGYNGNAGQVIIPIFEAAGIPFIGNWPNDALATSSPNSFPLTSGGTGLFAALPLQLQAAGGDAQHYSITDLGAETTGFMEVMVNSTMESAGIKNNGTAVLPVDAVDLAPAAAAATQGDTTGIGFFILGDAAKNFVSTIRNSGGEQALGTIAPFVGNDFVTDLGDQAEGLLVASSTRFGTTTKAGRKYKANMKAFDKSLPLNDAGATYWLGTWVFERVAKTLPTIDAASVLAAMGQLHDFKTGGMTPPISTDTEFAGNSPFPLPRLFNPTAMFYEVKNGKLVESTGEFVDPFAG